MSDALLRPPEYICLSKVQQSLRNVRHLSLRTNRFLTDASFNQMLTLMPNITSLCLAGCSNLQFHPGIFRRFHTDTIEFSSAVLTFQNVLACMMRLKQEFVDLDFSGTLINAKALIQIVELYRDSLVNLRLQSCDQLTTKAYEAIGECSKLRLLSLHRTCQTNDDHLEFILPKTPHLEYLDLGLCQLISSQSLERIVQLTSLKHLNLNACQRIKKDAWGSLGKLTALQHLDLSYTDCDVNTFRQLTTLKDLRTLELCRCFNLDSECFVIICDNFKRLEKLNLDFNITLTDEAGVRLHELQYLRSLEITGAVEISDRSLENGIGASDMKLLGMGLCSLLTDSALVSIANHHVCLEFLDLSSCVRITDVGLISVVQCLPRLRTLILKNCRGLTDRSLDALQDNCPHLRRLNVELCPMMSGDAIDLLAHQRPTIDIN